MVLRKGSGEQVLLCNYTDPPHVHVFPKDWKFGGANGCHPGADPRWKATTYTYFAADAQPLRMTQAPICDDQALDEFTLVAGRGNPKWLMAEKDGKPIMLPWVYDKESDTLIPKEQG